MPGEKDLVEMGRLGKALGLKGELFLIWHGERTPEKGAVLYLRDPEEKFGGYTLLDTRWQKDRLVARLQGVEDRNAAELLTGSAVFQPLSDLEQPAEDEAFLSDLLGSRIFLADGTLVGTLDHVEFPANQQIWAIKSPDSREILFPAQPCFIEGFYPEERKVIIAPPPGLMDIYNA